jgi:hypothetical protein
MNNDENIKVAGSSPAGRTRKSLSDQLMKPPGKPGFACTLFLVFFGGATLSAPAADDALAWPVLTSQTRPWAYWWWMGSAVDKTNLTRELQRYHDAGLGGVHIVPIFGAKGWESNYISYLSPRWMEMMGYTVTEAHRLDLGVDMTTGTGWCFGGPNVASRDANASVVVRMFDLAARERLKEKFDHDATQALVAFSPEGKCLELTESISTNGEVFFSPPNGTWRVYAISQNPSSQKVKRAAPGGEGWMLNPFYPPAMSNYLRRFSDAFTNYDGPKPRAQYQDSYEYKSAWSPDFFAQFEKRRGYKLQTELPALFGTNQDDHAARVKSDYVKPSPTSWWRNRSRSGLSGRMNTVLSRATKRTARPAICSTSTPWQTFLRRKYSAPIAIRSFPNSPRPLRT